MSLIYPDIVLEHSRMILVEATVPLILFSVIEGEITSRTYLELETDYFCQEP